ncbi:FAD-dependent oxidoreductase [Kribbella speibonae]|uniref:FAD-dependent oxidoreductase n=1 Tax=Kribbella speibonae TaxID=1572660 RepID=A0ABY2AA38_9ACTN|nr:FAD-dependent oxidoreductase [Kribbella speibonae]TCC26574.1 FAD-dependent oxidoreductase [Kribbella speibonae]
MYDVVIVGAGPVGLFLACEVGLAGCSVLVIEREPDGRSPWRAQPLGMRGLSAASVEAFARRGMLAELKAASGAGDEGPRGGGHFAGMMVDGDKVDELPFRLPSPVTGPMLTSLEAVESVLAERAAKLGVEIERGTAVSGVTPYDDHVVVSAGEREYAAGWVVGCDGGHSVVRGLAGFEFVGTAPEFTGYVMHATLADPEKLQPGFNLTPTGMYLVMQTDGHVAMMDFDGGTYDRSQELTREHLQAVLRRVSDTDVTVADVRLASSFTDRAMQATTYRNGRVLVAGDAAHIHAPLGGQGLNTGLGDAMNLGWKLAATVRGQAPDGLLDTYTSERHPIGAAVLGWTRAQAMVMRPGPSAEGLQGLIRDLLGTRDGATYVSSKLSGLALRYDLGSEHPLVGRNAPDFHLQDGTRLGDLLQDGRAVLLDFRGDLRSVPDGDIRYVATPALDDLGLDAVLVRPDGVVAWARDPEALEAAARRWVA